MFTDSLVLSRYNEKALSASLSVGLLILFISILFSGVIDYSSVLVAKAFGENNKKKITNVFLSAIIFSIVSFIIIFIFLNFYSVPLLHIFGHDNDHMYFSQEYLVYVKYMPFFTLITASFSSLFNGIHRTDLTMKISVIAVIINIILDIILVNGYFISNPMGIKGSALATILSQFVSLLLFCILLVKKNPLEISKINKNNIKEIAMSIKLIVIEGGFVGLEHFFYLLSNTFAINFMQGYNPLFSDSISIILSIDRIVYLPFLALSIAASIRVGTLVGEGKHSQIKKTFINTLLVSLIAALFFCILYCFFGRPITSIFLNNSNNHDVIISIAIILLRITVLKVIFDAIGMIAWGVLRGVGDTRAALTYSIISNVSRLIIVMFLILYIKPEYIQIWSIYCLLIGLLPSFGILRFVRGRWREKLTKNN
ncbi:putative efflux protein, MATE family [Treponema bryantii]|uniref:Multidrug-efflux transporter n=2 Tax=Treponema bryantii TaxID=163 RepID=A0A1H9C3L0_9SPIR|nr:putative efflux protein, MATE family [Treponema bryantii]